jgi:phosphoenolpyruvate carboxykinase (GTP)
MAMLPFCGYNMGDYWNHWLEMGRKEGAQLPRIFYVNWFRKGDQGEFLWPGFGENSRVLKWVHERCDEKVCGVDTPIGILPGPRELDLDGLEIGEAALETLTSVDVDGWLSEIPKVREFYKDFGEHLPEGLVAELDKLEARLRESKSGS